MIVGLDSAFAPSVAQAQAARAAGIGVWSGYLATKPNVGLYHPWSSLDFQAAKLCGGIPTGYCSGWDDPAACKALASAWGVRLGLDVEGGIRPDGAWVQGWLDASGAGLYGLAATHTNRRAAFHIMAWYPGYNPNASWPPNIARPSTPCGWQWQNTHQEFGVGVDRCWMDPWFGPSANATAGSEVIAQEVDMTPEQDALLRQIAINSDSTNGLVSGRHLNGPSVDQQLVAALGKLDGLLVAVKAIPAAGAAPDLSAINIQLSAIKADLDRIFKP